MTQGRILLLDFAPATGLSDELFNVVSSSSSPEWQIHRESLQHTGNDFYETDLMRVASAFKPTLAFAVLSRAAMEQSSSIIESVRKWLRNVPIIIAVESAEPNRIFELLKFKSIDFITPPFNPLDILPRIWRLQTQAGWRESLMQTLKEKQGCRQLIGESPAFLREVEKVSLMASCDASVMISGETGTGKEVFARAIHYLSPRASKPFIPVNCGAIPTELMENELFGHERGAFTGATTSRLGIIHEAKGGTLFLDEVDSLPLLAQVKLLRFLQEKEYRSLGSAKVCKADVRVIAATNTDFEEATRSGRLRHDLYYRLNVIPLKLPALRERQNDIPLLARHFLAKYSAEFDKDVTEISVEAIQKLLLYDWPGNVRELEHVIERAVVLCNEDTIQTKHIGLPRRVALESQKSFQEMKAEVITQFEVNYINSLLMAHGGNISKAAHAAQKNRRAFWQLINKHKIDVHGIKQNLHVV